MGKPIQKSYLCADMLARFSNDRRHHPALWLRLSGLMQRALPVLMKRIGFTNGREHCRNECGGREDGFPFGGCFRGNRRRRLVANWFVPIFRILIEPREEFEVKVRFGGHALH